MTSVAFDRFGGLDSFSDPEELGGEQAQSLQNVDFDLRGRVRMRNGSIKLNTTAAGGSYIYYRFVPAFNGPAVGLRYDGTNVAVDKIATNGVRTAVAAQTADAGTIPDIVAFGTPASGATAEVSYVFYTRGATGVCRKYDGTSDAASVGRPRCLAVMPVENRLVQGSFVSAGDTPSGADGSPSTVFFSDPNAPETFDATNFVHLRPGDGEAIRAIVPWNEQLFVFKETVCFIFYGSSTDTTGGAVFNYRSITLPGPVVSNRTNVTVGPDGVYFCTWDGGVYRTTGGPPARVSQRIEGATAGASLYLGWAGNRLWAGNFNQASDGVYSWDRFTDQWTKHVLPEVAAASTFTDWPDFTDSEPTGMVFGQGDDVYYFNAGTTTDNGTAITWNYQSGWYPLGEQRRARIRQTRLWGTGSPTLSVFTDHGSTDANAAAVTLGVSPAVAHGYHRKAYQGRFFSYKLSGTTAATVNRLVHDS